MPKAALDLISVAEMLSVVGLGLSEIHRDHE
jgi:hypothetical protein